VKGIRRLGETNDFEGLNVRQGRNQQEAVASKDASLIGSLFSLEIEAILTSETSVEIHWITRCYIPGDRIAYN
jgi:hypothetical protein